MKVKMINMDSDETIIISSIDECRDDIEKSIFELVNEFNDQITMGNTTAFPYSENNNEKFIYN